MGGSGVVSRDAMTHLQAARRRFLPTLLFPTPGWECPARQESRIPGCLQEEESFVSRERRVAACEQDHILVGVVLLEGASAILKSVSRGKMS